ncbi:hypothetical protein HDU99_000924 [Rhizoclosmatium hyalinum]|nr:hypothetical protein HDU99_000924 [Rhizoclosmatium hyalinum]
MFGAFARAIDPDKRRSSAVIAHSPNSGQRGENDEALAALINYSDQFLEIEKAKFELQRQQLELEKEKATMDQVKLEKTLAFQQLQLELEKEKVAHQFMLEKERLAFEREKFEFECRKWEETKVVPASSTYSVSNTAPVSRMIAPSTENSTARTVIPPPVNQSPKISQQAKNAKKVFISYCWSNSRSKTLKDIEAGVASTEDLDKTGFWDPRKETYEIIQQCGYEPWLDEFELKVGEDLFSQLARALKNEAALVIIHVSDEYAHSDNCRDEFLYANKLKLPIIPLIVGVPGASKSMEPWDVTSLGFQLSKYLYIDARDYHFIESKKEALIAAIKGKMEALAAASNDDVIPIAALPPVIASTHKPKKVFVSYSWANSRNQKMSDFQAGRATKTDVFDAGLYVNRLLCQLVC